MKSGAFISAGMSLVVVLSGCLGGGDHPSSSAMEPRDVREVKAVDAGASLVPDRCDLEGVVYDVTGAPIAGADVIKTSGMESSGHMNILFYDERTTDDQGRFQFLNLSEGKKSVGARKPGYGYSLQDIECHLGRTIHASFVLLVATPYHVTLPLMEGKIGCEVGIQGTSVSSVDLCDDGGLGVSKGAKTSFVPVPDLFDVTGMSLDVQWTPLTPGLNDCLTMVFPLRSFVSSHSVTFATNGYMRDYGNQGQWGDVTGRSILRMSAASPWEDPLYKFVSLGLPFEFRMRGGVGPMSALPEVCQSGVVAEQPFTFQLTFYYNGAVPVP